MVAEQKSDGESDLDPNEPDHRPRAHGQEQAPDGSPGRDQHHGNRHQAPSVEATLCDQRGRKDRLLSPHRHR